jgi:hypothetical protein
MSFSPVPSAAQVTMEVNLEDLDCGDPADEVSVACRCGEVRDVIALIAQGAAVRGAHLFEAVRYGNFNVADFLCGAEIPTPSLASTAQRCLLRWNTCSTRWSR